MTQQTNPQPIEKSPMFIQCKPITDITFTMNDGKETAKIHFKDGKMSFEGNADDAAQEFLNYLRVHFDALINQEVQKALSMVEVPEITFSKVEGMPNTLAVDFAQRHLDQVTVSINKIKEQYKVKGNS